MSRADSLASTDKKVQDHVINGEATDVEIAAADGESIHWVSVRRLVKSLRALVTPALDDRGKSAANTEFVRNQIESPNQAFPSQVFRKNRLINGNFDIWQRGASGAVGNPSGPAQAYYGPDRWIVYMPSSASATWERLVFTPGNGFNEGRYGLRVTRSGTSDGLNVSQRIEGVDTLAGKRVTVSFYMRSSIVHNCGVILRQSFGPGGSDGGAGVGVEVSVTTDFKKYVVSLDVPSIKGKSIGSDSGYLELVFGSLGKGAYSFDLASIQVEAGALATEFDLRHISQELTLCQRYFEKSFLLDNPIKSNNGSSTCTATFSQTSAATGNQSALRTTFRVTKRVTPAIRLYSPAEDSAQVYCQSAAKPCTSSYIQSLSNADFAISCTTPSGSLPGHTLQVEWTADAEI